MAKKLATFLFIFAISLLIMPIFLVSWNLDGDEVNVKSLKWRRYIAGEMPILPGGQGTRDGQQDGMMGNGMGSSGRKAGDVGHGDAEEDEDADDHIGESPNSVEAAAIRADWEKKKATKKNGQRHKNQQTKQNTAGRNRRTAARRNRMPFLEQLFEW